MRILPCFLLLSLMLASCTELTRLGPPPAAGDRNVIFVRPFSSSDAPAELTKLLSERFYNHLESSAPFNDKKGNEYGVQFYSGQPCPGEHRCYYTTGSLQGFKESSGCCGHDGLEATVTVQFLDDLSKKPLFELSDWRNEVYPSAEVERLQAMESFADDSAKTIAAALVKALSHH